MTVDTAHVEDEGRASAFRALFEAQVSYVWNSLRRLGIPEQDAEDLVHEVFVVVHRRFGDYDPERPLRPWLFGIAFRVASDYRRVGRNAREHLGSTPPDPADSAPGAEERLVADERRRLVLEGLEAIAEERRAVFVMHDIDEVAVPEIARTLGIPVNTAYSRLRLAREEFARAVARRQKNRGER